jgi:hypothetical protein
VTTWTASAGPNATQSTVGQKPTYKTNIKAGLPVVRFDGGDGLTTSSIDFSGSDKLVVMAVVGTASGGTDGVICETGASYVPNGFLTYRVGAGGKVAHYHRNSGGENADTSPLALATPFKLFTAISDRSGQPISTREAYCWNNGLPWAWYAYDIASASASGNNDGTGNFEAKTLSIGARDAGGTLSIGITADIAELIIYTGLPSWTQLGRVERYLNDKWDIY